ncbi:uncharacterized protein MELLADRAFT_58345 [Melampsora larici-populina 98AG31]|uniref:Uncharacterized protein n=1 Tax=Melampsora larici-populina (strain 98AG31 / pathotype 3-4-7) TaxID=747676 RepID=F4R360_MELLP|nr:uncharacterized protein MELLADRAFT_58345 [Melampsora larici-populina 98AG31]EGG13226.1 hypothetical protein MELLADRAFT_58345 [Melampsora larici-populina 98AG31]
MSSSDQSASTSGSQNNESIQFTADQLACLHAHMPELGEDEIFYAPEVTDKFTDLQTLIQIHLGRHTRNQLGPRASRTEFTEAKADTDSNTSCQKSSDGVNNLQAGAHQESLAPVDKGKQPRLSPSLVIEDGSPCRHLSPSPLVGQRSPRPSTVSVSGAGRQLQSMMIDEDKPVKALPVRVSSATLRYASVLPVAAPISADIDEDYDGPEECSLKFTTIKNVADALKALKRAGNIKAFYGGMDQDASLWLHKFEVTLALNFIDQSIFVPMVYQYLKGSALTALTDVAKRGKQPLTMNGVLNFLKAHFPSTVDITSIDNQHQALKQRSGQSVLDFWTEYQDFMIAAAHVDYRYNPTEDFVKRLHHKSAAQEHVKDEVLRYKRVGVVLKVHEVAQIAISKDNDMVTDRGFSNGNQSSNSRFRSNDNRSNNSNRQNNFRRRDQVQNVSDSSNNRGKKRKSDENHQPRQRSRKLVSDVNGNTVDGLKCYNCNQFGHRFGTIEAKLCPNPTSDQTKEYFDGKRQAGSSSKDQAKK